MPSNKVTSRSPWHVIFVLDDSGSMTGTPIESLNLAMKETIDEMEVATMGGAKQYFKVSVIKYGSESEIICENTTETTIDVDKVFSLSADSGLTNMAEALDDAKAILERNPGEQSDFRPYVFLLSDGEPTGEDPIVSAEVLKSLNIASGSPRIVTIGVGDDLNDSVMGAIASNPEFYKKLATPKDVINIFFPAIGTATQTATTEQDVEETIVNA